MALYNINNSPKIFLDLFALYHVYEVLLACVAEQYVCNWYPLRSEDCISYPESGVMDGFDVLCWW